MVIIKIKFILVKIHIDRSELSNKEEIIMKAFDILCFKTNNHMKRGQGILQFPVKSLYRIKKQVIDLVDFVNNMFKNRIQMKREFDINVYLRIYIKCHQKPKFIM